MAIPLAQNRVVKLCLDAGCLVVLLIPLIALYASGKPYRRGFYCDDTSIRYPFKESTVSNSMLIVFTTAIPFLTIIGVEFVRFQRSARRSSADLRSAASVKELAWISYNELIVFFFGNLANLFLTNIAKYSIGRLRPHFMQVCRPRNLETLCPATANNFNYIENYECMSNDGARLKEARLSFFSGHSSIAAYAMVFTVIYIQYKVKWQSLSLLRPLIQMSLIYLAIYTGLTRISDYKHHWSDVLIGLMHGTAAAVLTSHYVGRFFRRYPDKPGHGTGIGLEVVGGASAAGRLTTVTTTESPSPSEERLLPSPADSSYTQSA